VRYSPLFDFLEVLPQPLEHCLSLCIGEFLSEFLESEVDNVVVMNLLRRNVVAKFEPDTVEEVNLLGGEVRRMGTQIKDMFLAAWKKDFQG
jgi:hypothetical protein